MSTSTQVNFWGSLIFGLVGAVSSGFYLRNLEKEHRGGSLVELVAASKPLSPGDTLSKSSLAVRKIPHDYVDSRHIEFERADSFVGMRIDTLVQAGELLTTSDLQTERKKASLAKLVEPGKRAFSIRAEALSVFGGLLKPGDRVDVLALNERSIVKQNTSWDPIRRPSHAQPTTHRSEPQTRLLIENLLVVAVGSEFDRNHAQRSTDSSSVSLCVSTRQARVLSDALSRERLRLALRNPLDFEASTEQSDKTHGARYRSREL